MDAFSKISIVSNYRTGALTASNGDVLEGLLQLAFANNNEIVQAWQPDMLASFSDSLALMPFSNGAGEGSGDTDGNGSGNGGLFGRGAPSTGSGHGNGASGGPVQVFAGMSLNWIERAIGQLEQSDALMGQLAGGRLAGMEGLGDYAQACLDVADHLRAAAEELTELLSNFPDDLIGAPASAVWSSLWGLELRSILTGAATLFQEIYNSAPPDGVAGTGWALSPLSIWRTPFMGVPGWLTGEGTVIEDFFAALDRGWLNGGVPSLGSGSLSGWGTGTGGNGNSGADEDGAGEGTGSPSDLFGIGNSASGLSWDVSNGNSDWLSPLLLMSPAMAAATDYYDALSLASCAPAPVTALDDWLSALLPSDGLAPFAFTASSYATTLPEAFATGVRLDTPS